MAVIETMTFELLPDVDAVDYLALDEQIQTEWTYQQPGIVRRTLAQSDADWLVETWWQTLEDASTAAERFTSDPLFASFAALVDQQSIRISRHETV